MKLIVILFTLLLVSCGNDSVKVINNSERVSDLERRVEILEQVMQTKASTQSLIDQNIALLASISDLKDELILLGSDAYDDLHGQGSTAYADLLYRINQLNSNFNNAVLTVGGQLTDINDELADLQDQINNLPAPLDFTINLGSLFTIINVTQQTIIQNNVDLSGILARLTALEANTYQAQIDDLQGQLDALQDQLSQSTGSTQLTLVSIVSRTNGNNNNASVTVKFRNVSNVHVSRFKVSFQTNGNAVTRSGSSVQNGNVVTYTSNSVTFQNTSSGIAPNGEVQVTILLDKLQGSDHLNFTTEVQ